MAVVNRKDIRPGMTVDIVLKQDQRTGKTSRGVVREILTDIDGIAFVYMDERDVVRHKIVQEIVRAYRIYDDARDGNKGTSR